MQVLDVYSPLMFLQLCDGMWSIQSYRASVSLTWFYNYCSFCFWFVNIYLFVSSCCTACLYLPACLCLKRNWARLNPYGPPPEIADTHLSRINQKYHNGTLQVQTKDRKIGTNNFLINFILFVKIRLIFPIFYCTFLLYLLFQLLISNFFSLRLLSWRNKQVIL